MRKSLSSKDREVLRNLCRMGLVISLMVCMFIIIVGVTVYESYVDLDPETLNTKMVVLISMAAFLISSLLNLLLYYKYYADLQVNEKIIVEKSLQGKSKTMDSGSGGGGGLSRTYIIRYEFVVDDIKFGVDEKLFESCSEGDKLIFSYASKSKYLLTIEKGRP